MIVQWLYNECYNEIVSNYEAYINEGPPAITRRALEMAENYCPRSKYIAAKSAIIKNVSKIFQKTSSNGKKQLCCWKFPEIENLLETFYRDNHKKIVLYLH